MLQKVCCLVQVQMHPDLYKKYLNNPYNNLDIYQYPYHSIFLFLFNLHHLLNKLCQFFIKSNKHILQLNIQDNYPVKQNLLEYKLIFNKNFHWIIIRRKIVRKIRKIKEDIILLNNNNNNKLLIELVICLMILIVN